MSGTTFDLAVVGAGAWGTALAILADRAGSRTALWGRPGKTAESLRQHRRSPRLPDIPIPDSIEIVADLTALSAPVIVMAVPVKALAACAVSLAPGLAPGTLIATVAKGFQPESGERGTALLTRLIPQARAGVLSGPTFAAEAAAGAPTAATVAFPDLADAERVVAALAGPSFRLYTSADVVGVEVLGAVKNVLAIACGIADGMGLGDNARAALITRGMAEITRLVRAEGGRIETVTGLSGFGDIVLTCTSAQSRNYRYGRSLGRAAESHPETGDLVEGAATAEAVKALGDRHGIEMPITAAVTGVLAGRITPQDAVHRLLARPLPGSESGSALGA
ncbi:MAG: NAD(P)-dependent glycerol-3-phosphate dehydrogenase [Alphaproteobacteria bacterium]|nr:NAD(P)-dependent glycerol-3-phosphate dehydrogenase [Alphaproteobacteria bacterium]